MAKEFGLVVPLLSAAHPLRSIGQGAFRLLDLILVLLGFCQKNEEMGDKEPGSGGGEGGDTLPDTRDSLRCPSRTGHRPVLEYHGVGGPEREPVFRGECMEFIGLVSDRPPVAGELREETSVRER